MTASASENETIVRQFKSAWDAGDVPDLASFRPPGGWTSTLLHKLVMIDQEFRWSQAKRPSAPTAAPEKWLLEDYQRLFPDVQNSGGWPVDVIAHEYYVRHCFGDQPSHAEMLQRFPGAAGELPARLRTVDQQLSTREQERDSSRIVISLSASADTSSDGSPLASLEAEESIPERIGDYRILRKLGKGGFGVVYLGYDEQLKRSVAIKVPHRRLLSAPDSVSEYLQEARTVAALDHPRIVPVYHVGQTPEYPFFIVSKYIDGQTLKKLIDTNRPNWQAAAQLVASIADALHYAHKQGVYHRDIKPANLLLDSVGNPNVADFGVALQEKDYGIGSGYVGTPAYFSPEQARGEGHLVDGRSDLFSLGIVLYELLTGQRPFTAKTRPELLERIESGTAKPPRSIDDTIPPELERICLKALANQISARYTTGLDIADDLRACLRSSEMAPQPTVTPPTVNPPPVVALPPASLPPAVMQGPSPEAQAGPANDGPAASLPSKLIPRGLRAFTADDREFFLDLLPGPRNRSGLPESIAFWKTRIEQRDATQTFSVGLIYGPSGCGKSSLVKAGLLPRLAPDISAIYLEASATDTEERLCRLLRNRIPELSKRGSVVDLLTEIRRNRSWKVVIVLDQFEQWLHAHPASMDEPLVRALRQCDGGRLQAVLMIRDDFFVSISRLMETLDVKILQAHNCAMVDLFAMSHAEAVLTRLGVAYEQLPSDPAGLSPDQQQFIHAVVQELAEGEQVISVRLALFAQMVRNKPWTPETLTQIGGAKGVGVAFLEETFSSSRSDVRYRRHAPAVRGILKALLPGIDTEIKGSRRSREELRLAADYRHRDQDFTELLEILDQELRLITPTETISESAAAEPAPEPSVTEPLRSWQLTHDYLVPSIREWLTRKQKETAAGRAELKLEDRTALYTSRRDPRYLPGFFDWLQILTLTRRKRWTPAESDVMRVAGRRHLLRGTAIATVLLAVGLVLQSLLVARALDGLAGRIRNANPSGLTELLADADRQGSALDDRLRPIIQAADQPQADAATKLAAVPARLVVVIRDESQLVPLAEALLTGELTYVEPIRTRLRLYADRLRPKWLELLRNSQEPSSRRFRAALGVVGLDGDQASADWTDEDLKFVAAELTTAFAGEQSQLRDLLRPIKSLLIPELRVLFDMETSISYAEVDEAKLEDPTDPLEKVTAQKVSYKVDVAVALADFAGDDPVLLVELLEKANAQQTKVLYPKFAQYKNGPVRERLLALTREQPARTLGEQDRVTLGRRRANAAITLLRQGERDAYFGALRITDDPESLSQFVHRCRSWGVTPLELLESIERCEALRGTATGASRRLESRVLYGLLIALGSYPLEQIPAASREEVLSKLRVLYEQDASASVHSASGWLLRTWGRGEDVAKLDEVEVPYDASGERDWFRLRVGVRSKATDRMTSLLGFRLDPNLNVQSHSLTFVVFPAGEYRLGSPEYAGGEIDRRVDETPRVVRFSRPFALCDREVTWGLYNAFDGGAWREGMTSRWGWDLSNDDVVFGVNYMECIKFCSWLTVEYRGDADVWQCYGDVSQLDVDGDSKEVGRLLVDRGGFRMPTASEWEAGGRSGQRTAYTIGSDVSLLSSYGWFEENSDKRPQRTASKPPGVGGLHDIQGNVNEWVHDWYGEIKGGSVLVDPQGPESGRHRVYRGGGWGGVAALCRVADRGGIVPAIRRARYCIGFRLALSPSEKPQPQPEAEKQPEPKEN